MSKPVTECTFYCYDVHNKRYLRLAFVESQGLIHIIGQELKKYYPDNLYWSEGKGKKYIPYNPLVIMDRVK
jgi:hypothetical protein